MAQVPTAIAAVLIGAALLALTLAGLRWLGSRRSQARLHLPGPVAVAAAQAGPAAGVLVTEAGGRLVFANDQARLFFGLDGERPGLNTILRLAQPADRLLELLAAEGCAELSVGERRLEATSLHLPHPGPQQVVVILREAGPAARAGSSPDGDTPARLVAEIGQAFGASLDLAETYAAIARGLSRAFQFHLLEINLCEPDGQVAQPAYHAGDENYPRELAAAGARYDQSEGYTGWIMAHQQPLLVPSVAGLTAVRPKLDGPEFPFESFVGAPLLVEDELIGTLELAHYHADAYRARDRELLALLAPQAARAIRNAQRFAEQQRRVSELSGLADITRALQATSDPRELYGQLAADIARYVRANLAGLLVHDARANALVGRPPFYGMPDYVAEVLHLPLTVGSAAERLWSGGGHWQSADVPNDPAIDDLGLRGFAATTGAQTALLAPVSLGERRQGLVLVCNKADGAAFQAEDARLLSSFAMQVAAVLENARLVDEARARAEEAEVLRTIANTAAEADIDTTLRLAMEQAAGLLHFELGMVVLLDEARGELVPHPASVFGGPLEEAQAVRLRTSDPFFSKSITVTRRPFITGRAQRDRRLVGFYRALTDHFQIESAMGCPLVVGERGLGEVIVVARREHAFDRTNLKLLGTVAAQMASAIERARLYAATDQNLQRRVDQLTALGRVSRELSQTLQLERILRLVHDEAMHATRADCATIVLLDLEAGPGTVALRLGDEALGPQLTPLEAQIASGEHAKRRVADLATRDPLAAHPGVHAALVVPITVHEQVVGLIHLHSQALDGFDAAAEDAALALAAQMGIAVENARRFDEQVRRGELLRRRADQLAQLFAVSRSVRSDRPLAENLEAIAFGLQEAVGFDVVLISVLDPKSLRLRRMAAAGLPLAEVHAISQTETPWHDVARVLRDEYRLSQSYFLPSESTRALTAHLQRFVARPEPTDQPTRRTWRPDDMLLVPLLGSGHETVGLLGVDSPRDGQRPDRNTIEIIEIFANQAAQAIENARLYEAAQRRAAQLLALHRVVEAASVVANRPHLWQTVAETLLAQLPGPDVCLIALRERPGAPLELAGKAGQLRPHLEFVPLLAAHNPLLQALADRVPSLVLNTSENEWALHPFVAALEVGSFVTVPLLGQGQEAGALFAGAHHRPEQPSPFSPDDLDVFTVLANQLTAIRESDRLEADIERRAAQLAALAEVSQTITATLRREDVVQAVLRGLQDVVPYDSVTLWLRDGEQLRIAAAEGFDDNTQRLGLRVDIADSALFAEMSATLAPILVPVVADDVRFAAGDLQPTQSWLAAPLLSKGRVLGVLALDKSEPRSYTPQSTQVLMAFANQAAVALDNAQLFEDSVQRTQQLDERSQRLALLNRVSAQLSRTLHEDEIFAITLAEILGALEVERALMITLDERDAPRLASRRPAAESAVTFAGPALDRVRQTSAPLAIEAVEHDSLLGEAGAQLAAEGVKSLLVVPLVVGERLLALIQAEETRAARRFTPGEIELAQTLANQAAVAVQNARLYTQTEAALAERTRAEQELRRRHEELVTLNRVTTAVTSQLDLVALLETAAREMVQVFGARNCGIALLNPERTHLTVITDYSARPDDPVATGLVIPLEGNESSIRVIETGTSLVLPKAYAHPMTVPIHAVLRERRTECLMIVPLLARGTVIGTIGIDTDQPREFTPAEVTLAETLAGQIAGAVENARFAQELEVRVALRTQELQRERERVETLLLITTELTSSLDLGLVLTRALQLVSDAIQATRGSIYLIDLDSDQLVYRAALGGTTALPPAGQPAPFKRNEGLVGWVIKNREGVVIGDLEHDPRWQPLPDHEGTYRSAVVVPLMASEDALGAMVLLGPERNLFSEEHLRLVAAAANQVGAAINNAELYRLIRDQAERLGGMLRAQQVEATKSRAILEGIADGVLVAGAQGEVIVFNLACERILGLQRDEVLGRPVNEFLGIYGGAGRAWLEAVDRWSRDPASYQPGDFVDERLQLEDQRVISVHLAPVVARDDYLGSVSVIRDITREVEVDRLKSEFVSNVSHELRTPMTSIKGYADLLLMGAAGALPPNQARFLEVIKSNADRLGLLVNDLLDISRIESGRVELVMRPTMIGDLLEDVVRTVQGRADDQVKLMTLRVEVEPSLPPVWGDRERITQIIMNLADNAYNYSHEGGTITLHAGLTSGGRQVLVEVTDSGVGIAPEDQPRLFDRFYRGEDALVLATAGTGLGLSIARQLAEMHGGQLWLARSEPGRGSTFALTLPVAGE